MSKNPNKCSCLDCTNDLGPDSLEINHKGQPAGGICDVCLAGAKQIKIFLQRDKDGKLVLEHNEII